jgi:hypothetical protein
MKSVSTSLATLRLEEDRIIRILFVQDGDLNEAAAIEILGGIIKLSEGKPQALLYDFNQRSVLLSNIAKRLASARNEQDSNLLARAFLTYNLQNNIEATHFIQYNKPLCETRIFQKEELALAWLRQKTKKKSTHH